MGAQPHWPKLQDATERASPTHLDEISIRLLKNTRVSICEGLSRLLNTSFNQGKVPQKWKQANVTPIYKKGDRQLVSNYRPISLLSVIGKIQEKVVFKSMYNFFKVHNLLTWRNSGFKPLDSAMNQLILVTHKIYMALEHGQDINIAFLDVSKAFDRVWHTGLIHKLKVLGITGRLLKWLTDYLDNRHQRVVINGVHSDWLIINSGVPQGSILGPLLFLVYINDIIIDIDSDIFLYADDTIIMRVITDPLRDTMIMNDDLELLNQWAKQWAITFSPAKSEQLIISKKLDRVNYRPLKMGNAKIKRVAQHSHLGVIFNENCTWDAHIRSRINKAAPALNMLIRNSRQTPRQVKENIYRSFIRPVLEYGCTVYDNCPAVLSHLIERTQRQAAIACTGAYRDTSHVTLLNELGWPTLSKRRDYYKLCQLYKLVNNISPSYLIEYLPINVVEHDYGLRNNNDIRLPHTRTLSYRNSFIPSAIRLWNGTNIGTRNSQSLLVFKRLLKISMFPVPNPLHSYGRRDRQVHHARIRMGLSPLNQHRHKYNYINDPSCNSCGHRHEDTSHYFLECPSYQRARAGLLHTVNPIIKDIMPDINQDMNRRVKQSLINILLNGDCRLNPESNRNLFEYVQVFIETTGRMSRS